MNYRMILNVIGNILKVIGIMLLVPVIVALIYQEGLWNILAFGLPAVGSFAVGFLLSYKKPTNTNFYAKEGLVIAGLSWFIISLVGCLPFIINGDIPSFIDAFFETVSGFTTTGATILSNVESLSHSSIFYRSFTHWLGGMGVLVFVLAFLPSNAQNIHLLRAESPGPQVGKLVSKIKLTATILYIIYGVLTLVEIIFLLCGGMSLFDSIVNSLATAGTGGFSMNNAGIGGYSVYCQIVIAVFMLIFGVNFNLYYFALIGHIKQAIKSEELRWYLIIIALATSVITADLTLSQNLEINLGFATNLKDAFFQVTSIITTTGFSTVDFNSWPIFSQTVLFVLLFVGGCAGSTAGGIKVSRFVILFKTIKQNINKMIHPHSVSVITFEGQKVEKNVQDGVTSYFGTIFIIFLVSTILISFDGYDITTNITAVATCVNNVGPGLNVVGPCGNFGGFSAFSKVVLIFNMIIGRLEIYPVLVLFHPNTWKNS
jgi:trk system potassium uptake protein